MSNTVRTINPTTEKVLEEYTLLTIQQAESALNKSEETFQYWKHTSPDERAALLNKMAAVPSSGTVH